MKKLFLVSIVFGLFLVTLLSGCGGGGSKTPPETVVFSDDFEDIIGSQWNLTNTPADNRKNWGTVGGTSVFDVTDAGGTLGKVIQYNSGNRVLLNGDVSLSDYTITVNVRLTDNNTQGICGRYQDGDHYYGLYLGDGVAGVPSSRRISLWNSTTRLQDAELNLDPNTYYTLKMVFSGANIKGYLNGVKYIDFTDSAPTMNGRFGIWPMSSTMYYADMKVTQP